MTIRVYILLGAVSSCCIVVSLCIISYLELPGYIDLLRNHSSVSEVYFLTVQGS